jgi:hypothetical protein
MNNDPAWASEAARFLELPSDDKWRWLAKLLFAITMLARGTYVVGGDGLSEPERMRRFNELAHRVAQQLKNRASGISGLPDAAFVKSVGEELVSLGVNMIGLRELLR